MIRMITIFLLMILNFSCDGLSILRPNKNKTQVEAPVKVIEDEVVQLPTIEPQAGLVDYGAELTISSKQPNVAFDYSINGGKTWLVGNKIVLTQKTSILYRARNDKKISKELAAAYTIKFKRVLILGNSILVHAPSNILGWTGNWGMAASSPSNDFLSLVKVKLQELNKDVVVKAVNIAEFEKNYAKYDLNQLQEYVDFKPDLVIIRIGDNVETYTNDFGEYYRKLVLKVTKSSSLEPRLICTSNFWQKENVHFHIEEGLRPPVKAIYYNISNLSKDPKNMALGQFLSKEVSDHPNDLGMKTIAEILISGINI